MTFIRIGVLALLLLIPIILITTWMHSAEARLDELGTTASPSATAPVAAGTDETYCNPELKKILRRVLMSCGLAGGGTARGCQPLQAKNVATLSGRDFNALFKPMKDRGAIIEFDVDKSELDPGDTTLVDTTFADQRNASWFFVVARASPEGAVEHNRELSKARAEAVMKRLREHFNDPDLDKEVGLLWLGAEFAQLETEFCDWKRSTTGTKCTSDQINRSAFIAWIDCQL